MNRDEFEEWYVKKYMAMMMGGKEAIESLRNGGGYDNEHIDGAWEVWQLLEHGVDLQCHVKVSFAQAFVFIVLMMAVTGLLYWVCFSESFYELLMDYCCVCREHITPS
jgi:hypothetical protein